MKQPATDPNAVTILPAQEQHLSLRIDEQLHGEAREYLRAGPQESANSQRAINKTPLPSDWSINPYMTLLTSPQ